MLKTINLKKYADDVPDGIMKVLLDLEMDDHFGDEIIPGFYIAGTNSHYFFEDQIVEEYSSFRSRKNFRDNYGVCDNHEQILKEYPELQECSDRNFVVLMTPIYKSEQDPQGGWRWHKWGPYIGCQNKRCEYLYDEPEIEMVYVYHIYEVK